MGNQSIILLLLSILSLLLVKNPIIVSIEKITETSDTQISLPEGSRTLDQEALFRNLYNTKRESESISAHEALFSTYIGGTGKDSIADMVLDDEANIYLAGSTTSFDFPTQNAYDSTYGGGNDGFLSKFTSTGILVFSTFIGGVGDDIIDNIYFDNKDGIYLTGTTTSSDFPVQNAFDPSYGGGNGGDGFLIKFNINGSVLFNTYIGGKGEDTIDHLQIDEDGSIYLSGSTTSSDFPVQNAFDAVHVVGSEGFLAKITSNGSLVFSTFIGANSGSIINYLVIDSQGCTYLTGMIYTSTGFPLQNAFDSIFGGNDEGFLTKVASNGSLIFSTYIGGSDTEVMAGLVIDSVGNSYLTGNTLSSDFPTQNAFAPTFGGGISQMGLIHTDGFLVKVTSNGTVDFSTYVGGTDLINNIILDDDDSIYLGGSINHGGNNLFLIKVSSDGTLVFSTYFGTGGASVGFLLVDFTGDIYSYVFENFLFETQYRSGSLIKFFPNGSEIFNTIIGLGSILYYEYNQFYEKGYLDQMFLDSKSNIYLLGWQRDGYKVDDQGYFDHYIGSIYLAKISSTGNFLFSTIIGGSENEDIGGLCVDTVGDLYLSGTTSSSDFDIQSTFDATYGGDSEGFLVKIKGINDNDRDGMDDDWEDNYGLNYNIDDAFSDLDNDGILNIYEYRAGLDPTINDASIDSDRDGMPNLWEYQMGLFANLNDATDDKDQDGMPNLWEYQHGFNAANPLDASWDPDGDDLPNYLEFLMKTSPFLIDSDNDGMDDGYEVKMGLITTINDAQDDKDQDGMPNLWEYRQGFNATNPLDATLDFDGDGLTNYAEFTIKTSPLLFDTDGDGIDDGFEYKVGFNPLIPDSHFDADGDWVTNLEEYKAGTDPFNIFSFPLISSNAVFVSIIFLIFVFILTINYYNIIKGWKQLYE